MSFASAMAVSEGIIMLSDHQITVPGVYMPLTRSAKKLLAVGDNIGICIGAQMILPGGQPVSMALEYHLKNKKYDRPEDLAMEIFDFMLPYDREEYPIGYTFVLAGYDKTIDAFPQPEIYFISTKYECCELKRTEGLLQVASNPYFKQFADKINNNPYYKYYTLQDAIDISKLAVDFSRNIERYLDFKECISPKIDMIAITPHGIQWIVKTELEVNNANA